MANKRMFSMTIVDSDAFLGLSRDSQWLYFHLNMRADDDGFVSNPKKVIRTVIGDNLEDYNKLLKDLMELIEKRFLLQFEDGVIVVKHWRMHNTLRKDRYTPTAYQDELGQMEVKENGAYTMKKEELESPVDSEEGLPTPRLNFTEPPAELEEPKKKYSTEFETFWKAYPRKIDKGNAYKNFMARLNDGWSPDELIEAAVSYAEQAKKEKTEQKYIKHPTTFLSATTPFVDYLKKKEPEEKNENTDDEDPFAKWR